MLIVLIRFWVPKANYKLDKQFYSAKIISCFSYSFLSWKLQKNNNGSVCSQDRHQAIQPRSSCGIGTVGFMSFGHPLVGLQRVSERLCMLRPKMHAGCSVNWKKRGCIQEHPAKTGDLNQGARQSGAA